MVNEGNNHLMCIFTSINNYLVSTIPTLNNSNCLKIYDHLERDSGLLKAILFALLQYEKWNS